ncbi:MAG TPA: alkaline phosphatase family protein [Candidatus Binatia bacterium]|nr:alkaline phosphatase family protein [Candidatus Binatia bacterium]
MSPRPVVLIGLDGASHAAFGPLIASGEMPTLGGLVARGASGVVRSVVPPITPAAWSSFMTGKYPGKHGVYDFRLYDPRTYRDVFVTSRALRDATMWETLTAAGRRVGVIGLPVTYPPDPRAGTVVSGFDTPSTAAAFTHPPALRERILAEMPDYAFIAVPDVKDPNLERDESFADFVRQVERGFEQRTAVALDLLADGAWDVFMVHYQDVDILQHRAWRCLEEPDAQPERTAQVRRAYRRLDTLLAALLSAAPPRALVLVVSDHGFGPHWGRVFPNTVLRDWGYLRKDRPGKLRRSIRKRLAWLGLVEPPAKRPKPEGAWISVVRETSLASVLALDWRRTRAYVAVAEMYGLLYLNVRGREPRGIVPPEEAGALRDELRARFAALADPKDGAPVFAEVLPGEAVYPEDPFGRRPDLVLVPRPGYTVGRDLMPQMWLDHFAVMNGTHRPEGVLVAAGDGVRSGPLAAGADLVDLAPTVLATAGVPVPADMDGRVLTELFLEAPEVSYGPAAERAEREAEGLAADEEDEVSRRLRALGYMA